MPTHQSTPQAQAQQPSAGSLTSSNSSSCGGSSSDGDDADETILQQDQALGLSRSSLMARRWGQASSALSEKAAAAIEEQDDSPSKPRPQALYVMNKARDLCARIRHQAKVKQREERKRILLQRYVRCELPCPFYVPSPRWCPHEQFSPPLVSPIYLKNIWNRQVARDLARQAAKNAREEEAREEAALRDEEAMKAARRELEREHLQALEFQADTFHALRLARVAIRQWQAFVQRARALRQEQQEREERMHQAAKMERLREGVLLVRVCVLSIVG